MTAHHPMPGCPHQDAVVARFLDGDAFPPAQVPNEVLDRHLLDCPDCRAALELARQLDALVARSADQPVGPAEPGGDRPSDAQIGAWLGAAEALGRSLPVATQASPAPRRQRVGVGQALLWALVTAAVAVLCADGYALLGGGAPASGVPTPIPSAPTLPAPAPDPQPPAHPRNEVLVARATPRVECAAPEPARPSAVVFPDVPGDAAARSRAALARRRVGAGTPALEVPEQRTAALVQRIERPWNSEAGRLVRLALEPDLRRDAWACLLIDPMPSLDLAALDLQAGLLAASWQALAAQALQRLPAAVAVEQLLLACAEPLADAQETLAIGLLALRPEEAVAQLRGRMRSSTPAIAIAAARIGLRLDPQVLRADLLSLWSRTQFDPDLGNLIERELAARPGEACFAVAFQAALAASTGSIPQESHLRWFPRLPRPLVMATAQRGEAARAVGERILCLRILGMSGDDTWLGTLRQAAESRHLDERLAGHLALRDLGTRAATAALIELAERSRHPWTAVASMITSPADAVRNEGLLRAPAGTPPWPGGRAGPDALASLELQLGRLARRGP